MFLEHGKHYELTGQRIGPRGQIRLLQDLECGCFTVPKGFLSDGASIPKFADNFFGLDPLRDEYLFAALVHDFAYSTQWGSRWECDLLFAKTVLSGTNRPLRWLFAPIMLFSVRIGGFEGYYAENRKLFEYFVKFNPFVRGFERIKHMVIKQFD